MALGFDLSGAMRQVQEMQEKLDKMNAEMEKQTQLQEEQVALLKQLIDVMNK